MNRAGTYITALSGDAEYKAYKPNPLPPIPSIMIDNDIIKLLAKAHNLLGQLDKTAELIPNMDLFLGSYVRKEALLSSQIEGTQATLEDILNPTIETSINLEVADVVNYVNALNFAIEEMKKFPLCNRLLRGTHKVLMQGVRGENKTPGEFRRSQNWIGSTNSNIKNARYVPPTVEDMNQAMSDLEKFINNDEMDILLKTALVHYQFETIHPFLDGNGRVGRMLITLMLINNGILKLPVLYMSLFLKTNRVEYYDRLGEVRNKGDFEQWIKFFLNGIVETCNDCLKTIGSINSLILSDELKLSSHSLTLTKVFNYIQEHPIVTIKQVSKDLNISFNTASNSIKKLEKLWILNKTSSKLRDRVYEYSNYINILKTGT